MYKSIFVSHSSKDKSIIEGICDQLEKRGISLWISSKDVKPGLEWDKSIENALDKAEYVLLMVSKASIDSSYVRTEIEYALNEGKVVIPILLEQVKLPLRWHTLQFVDYGEFADRPAAIEQIVKLVPKSSVSKLKEYLENQVDFQLIQELIWENPLWIDDNAYLGKHTDFACDFYISKIFSVGGVHEHIYLGSPYAPPFQVSGAPTDELLTILSTAHAQCRKINGRVEDMLHNVQDPHFDAWEIIRSGIPSIYIRVIMGRYEDYVLGHKSMFEVSWLGEFGYLVSKLHLHLSSYDQLLKKIVSGSGYLNSDMY
jgi:hypothetical protein